MSIAMDGKTFCIVDPTGTVKRLVYCSSTQYAFKMFPRYVKWQVADDKALIATLIKSEDEAALLKMEEFYEDMCKNTDPQKRDLLNQLPSGKDPTEIIDAPGYIPLGDLISLKKSQRGQAIKNGIRRTKKQD